MALALVPGPEPDSRWSVLLVEDNGALRRVFERSARTRPEVRLRTAASVGEARELLSRETFDRVIADFLLGHETSAELVRDLLTRGVEVFVVTGTPEAAREALGSGIRILAKPADLDVLLSPGSDESREGPSRSATRLRGQRPAPPRSRVCWALGGFAVGLAVGVALTWAALG